MENKKIKKFVLTIPDPLSIETEGLGRILVSNWTVEAISNTSKIIERNTLTPKEFIKAFIGKLARIPSGDEKIKDQYEKGIEISNSEALTDNDREKIAREYINAWKNQILYWVAYEDEDKSNLNLEKGKQESDSEYFFRIIKISVEKSEELSRKMFEKYNYFGSNKGFIEEFTKNQQKLGVISEKIKGIQKSAFKIPNIESLHTKPLELPPNPVHKTNQLLDVQLSQLESLSKLVEAQGEQAVILNEQTALLLRESVKSSVQAKIGVWIAAVGILIGASLNACSIYRTTDSRKDSTEISKILVTNIHKETINNQKEALAIAEMIKSDLTEVKKSINVSSENTAKALKEIQAMNERNSSSSVELAKAIKQLSAYLARNGPNEQFSKDVSR